MKIEIKGPYSEPRKWLLKHLKTMRFSNPTIEGALKADWSEMSREKASYLVGTIWGRMRQLDSSLESNVEYLNLLIKEFDNE